LSAPFSTRLEGLIPQPTTCAVKLAEALAAYGLVRTSCLARARCSSPPWRIMLLMLSPPAPPGDQAALHLGAI
jgi:hypothetical protein